MELITTLLQYTSMALTVIGVFFTGGKTRKNREIGFLCASIGCVTWIIWGIMIALTSSILSIGGILFTNVVVLAFSVRGFLNNSFEKSNNSRNL